MYLLLFSSASSSSLHCLWWVDIFTSSPLGNVRHKKHTAVNKLLFYNPRQTKSDRSNFLHTLMTRDFLNSAIKSDAWDGLSSIPFMIPNIASFIPTEAAGTATYTVTYDPKVILQLYANSFVLHQARR